MRRTFAVAVVVASMCVGQSPVGFAQTGSRAQQEPEFTQAGQVVEGKISAVKEYVDTKYAHDLLFS